MDLQEMITRGRFIFSAAPGRLSVFELLDGRRSTEELAKSLRRHVNSIRRDLTTMENAGLIQLKSAKDGSSGAYEKVPLAKTIPLRYFRASPAPNLKARKLTEETNPPNRKPFNRSNPVPMPTEQDVLDICKNGEDQLYEFKAAGTEARKLAREACAMMNTKDGGIILYGV